MQEGKEPKRGGGGDGKEGGVGETNFARTEGSR